MTAPLGKRALRILHDDLDGRLDAAGRAERDRLLRVDPGFARRLAEHRRLRRLTLDVGTPAAPAGLAASISAAIREQGPGASATAQPATRRRFRSGPRMWVGALAGLAAALLVLLSFGADRFLSGGFRLAESAPAMGARPEGVVGAEAELAPESAPPAASAAAKIREPGEGSGLPKGALPKGTRPRLRGEASGGIVLGERQEAEGSAWEGEGRAGALAKGDDEEGSSGGKGAPLSERSRSDVRGGALALYALPLVVEPRPRAVVMPVRAPRDQRLRRALRKAGIPQRVLADGPAPTGMVVVVAGAKLRQGFESWRAAPGLTVRITGDRALLRRVPGRAGESVEAWHLSCRRADFAGLMASLEARFGDDLRVALAPLLPGGGEGATLSLRLVLQDQG